MENMEAEYSEWDLESTAKLINKKYNSSYVWVVKPNKMIHSTYTSYNNFVQSGAYGIPIHKAAQKSWQHLQALLHNGFLSLLNMSTDADLEQMCAAPVCLIGFSKGCVVLNQLLYDLSELDENDKVFDFVKKVNKMIWLDGGHSGSSNTWLTNAALLRRPAALGVHFECHVTPYQINDQQRPWIGKEYLVFIENLRSANVSLTEKIHFENKMASLTNHFNILKDF